MRNQILHLVQWLTIIIIMVLFLVYLRIGIWVKLVIIGTAFLIGFLLRVFGGYPGNYEPPVVDILTAMIAYLSIIIFIFIKEEPLQLTMTMLVPFIILIPHFVYIIRRKDIEPPGLRKIFGVIVKKTLKNK